MSSQYAHRGQDPDSSQSPQLTTTGKVRGPFPIEVLAQAAGVSVEQVRQYQRQGLIPHRREWHTKGPAMFYRSDLDKIEHTQQKEKRPDAGQMKMR